MSVTIQTGELCGLINDAAPFAFPEDDLPDLNVIRLEWEGGLLHATATDSMRSARSSWSPDDEDGQQDTMFAAFGGADDRWVIYLGLADAKEVVKVFKLSAKESGTPLTLTCERNTLTVDRSRDTGHQAVKMRVDGKLVNFPDLSKDLDHDLMPEAVEELSYVGPHLAAFGLVRQRGTFLLTFGGLRGITRVQVGDRFVGAIRPQPVGSREDRQGVLVGADN